ncbi:haloacid dehalogenase family hydrolase [Entamoeba histolytica HM-1:IMSS-B]|uniref:Haloacid dehalogenase-like hydrolase n=6 Tax=Entamoeba histolytica TaxID=5759 RepID=C4LSN2_ENTH1|nr:hypothetical protein, conserved [Entamoeba histolytica HM-1:IMSS]EMD46613.1 haloacid dehalogenase hydrolase, putative [Entamoeba histolytica KU27]EMH72499.1 haloacid dehalogenase family hydrolase [Entamoeba histolytica HM-1:IMSS-B]EMS17253.1 haloacid dehalogenase hydrolase family protein [Entamoeba histolytica HM-3:IMSS]ENY59891.1 haloacid dehalogenase family hydrolase, putative [Entamoeba histolytica HM-1:IMSS-A]BAN38201.1 hypothetical protein, conserved [Entamoeba histolytica]|eukprot:XP_657387.1 hypothetical protein, conserved [Entamoeba histolytica HM-1:IMSS]
MNAIKPKTIVLDVDGTLTLPTMMTPTEKVKQALQREIQAGSEILIASGRPLKTVIPIVESVGCSPITVLTSNGNLTVRIPERKVLAYHPLNIQACVPIIEALVKEGVCGYLVLCNKKDIENGGTDGNARIEDYLKIIKEEEDQSVKIPPIDYSKFQHCDRFIQPISFEEVKKMKDSDILSIHIHPSTVDETIYLMELLKKYNNHDIEVKCSGEKIIELYNPRISKGTILEQLHYQGLVVYMGDSENDITGIEWAVSHNGYGVAMGNAFDSVKEKSNFITKTVQEDGVAYALEWINSALDNSDK